jgi:hypothetical protein
VNHRVPSGAKREVRGLAASGDSGRVLRHLARRRDASDAVAERFGEPEVSIGAGHDASRLATGSDWELRHRAVRGDARDVVAILFGEREVPIRVGRDLRRTAVRTDSAPKLRDRSGPATVRMIMSHNTPATTGSAASLTTGIRVKPPSIASLALRSRFTRVQVRRGSCASLRLSRLASNQPAGDAKSLRRLVLHPILAAVCDMIVRNRIPLYSVAAGKRPRFNA